MPLDKTDDMGDWIKDFQKSKAPQFKGKSQEKRRQMAIAAKLATENNALREADITIYEKRAFILAAKQAFLDGKKTFMFKEKEYKCTVKEEQDLFGELTDYLLSKKEDVDTATMADVDDGADAPGDIDPEDLESARDHAAQRFKKFNSEQSGDDDLPPHTDIQESTIGDTLFKGSSNGQLPQWSKTRINFDPFKFHDMKIGKPLVAHVFEKEVYKDNVFTDNYDVVYFTDGKYMLSVMGDREKHPGGSNYGAEDASEMLVINKDGKANYNDFKKAVMKDAKTYNQAPMKLLKVDTKVRDFSKSPNSQDSPFTLRKMPKTAFRPSKDDIQEVKYHDRESMPSAVDDAANVMSKLDVYANFIKKTY